MSAGERRTVGTVQTADSSDVESQQIVAEPTGLTLFRFQQQHDVRVIADEQGEPWFVANDVARLLGYSNASDAISRHCKGGRETRLPSAGGMQLIKVIPERDVYRLIMRSQLPAAEAFEDWVVSDVLPSIRKTGGYGQPTVPGDYVGALRLALELAETNERLQIDSDALHRLSIAEGDYTPTAAAKVLQIQPQTLFKWLAANRWTYRGGDSRWSGYQQRIDQGHLKHKVRSINVGDREKVVHQLRVTAKGLALISKRLTEEAQ